MRRILSLLGCALLVAAAGAAEKEQGYLGAQLAPGPDGEGISILAALPNSPAWSAGFKAGDLVLRLGDFEPSDPVAAADYLRSAGVGSTVDVTYLRKGKERRASVTLGRNPWQNKDEPDSSEGLFDVAIEVDVPYREGDGADAQHKLDLYRPHSAAPTPVLLWIHGGGWSLGSRTNERALALRFAERGVAVAAMSYRLSASRWARKEGTEEGVVHPAHVNDVADAFAWLHTNAPSLNVDREAIFVGGHSAGGHLSALVASDPRYLNARRLTLADVAGALPIGGTYDIPDYRAALRAGDTSLAETHISAVFGDERAGWEDASPTEYLSRSNVPMLVVVEDQKGFQRYAKRLKKAARRARRDNITFLDAKNRTHGNVLLLMSGRHADEVRAQMLAFMRDNRAEAFRNRTTQIESSATRMQQSSLRTSARSAPREAS